MPFERAADLKLTDSDFAFLQLRFQHLFLPLKAKIPNSVQSRPPKHADTSAALLIIAKTVIFVPYVHVMDAVGLKKGHQSVC